MTSWLHCYLMMCISWAPYEGVGRVTLGLSAVVVPDVSPSYEEEGMLFCWKKKADVF